MRPLLTAITLAVAAITGAAVAAAMLMTWQGLATIGNHVARAVWLLPALIALHLFQLLLAGLSWRAVLARIHVPCALPGRRRFYRLRIIREGIDSLLPVAQVGGEIIGARLLAQAGITGGMAAASVVVDVTVELITHLIFLLCGLAVVALLAPAQDMLRWTTITVIAGLTAAGLVLAQRFGGLRLIELFMARLASRWPAMTALTSLAGLHDATARLYRQPGPILRSLGLHQIAWFLGTIETWSVLHALASVSGADPASVAQAFAIESLGMAARSAGFAIPGALGLQEGGFVLAALAVGVPAGPALALSLIKRLREIAVGLIGLALWRLDARRRPTPATI